LSNKNFLVKNGITVGSFNLVNENGNITANSITFLDGSTQSSGQNITSNSINTSSINTSSISANSIVTNFITFSDGSRQSSIPKTLVGNENFSTATYYPLLTLTAAGSITSANTSSLGLSYVPSTGILSATGFTGSGSTLTNIPAANVFTSTTQNSQFNSIGVNTAASGTAGEIRATNNITAGYSDDKLKTKLGNITNALEKLLSINGFYYEPNETAIGLGYKQGKQVGVSAQEMQKVLPEVVVPAPIDDKYLTVQYEKIIPLLIEAIKAQQIQIDALTQKVK
jgi:hypothetical protein